MHLFSMHSVIMCICQLMQFTMAVAAKLLLSLLCSAQNSVLSQCQGFFAIAAFFELRSQAVSVTLFGRVGFCSAVCFARVCTMQLLGCFSLRLCGWSVCDSLFVMRGLVTDGIQFIALLFRVLFCAVVCAVMFTCCRVQSIVCSA